MAIKLIKRHILLAGAEGSGYGQGATLAGADGVMVENFSHNPNDQATILERLGITGALSNPKQQLAGRLAGVTFDAELKTGNALDVPPEIGPLLEACGLEETINAATDVTYSTAHTAEVPSAAADLWDGGADRHQLVGIRGSVGLTLEAGTFGKWNFTLTAHPASPTAVARPVPVYDTDEPEPLKSLTMTIGGYGGWEVYSAALDMQTQLSAPPAMTVPFPSGYSQVLVTSFNPQIVMSYAAEDIADGYDPFGDMDSGASKALVVGPIGDAGNRVTINAPTATITNIATGDQEGRLTYEVTYQLAESALGAEDNFTIVMD